MASIKQIIEERRRERQNIAEFRSLVASPAVGAVTMPANARLAFRSTAGAAAGTTAATIAGPSTRTIKTPTLSAGGVTRLECAEVGSVVTPAAGFDVLLDSGLGKLNKIAGV